MIKCVGGADDNVVFLSARQIYEKEGEDDLIHKSLGPGAKLTIKEVGESTSQHSPKYSARKKDKMGQSVCFGTSAREMCLLHGDMTEVSGMEKAGECSLTSLT